ncbi:hypothetical protein Y032_0003g1580 [Ancylostoma ceylanicum]|uniref:Uncharacterized protein n=1 Tax=Ancylostoma ceylanicum TaxID=53326 RepID=A0A016VYG1_9BILA|nr:hypothetical protein Y032_0003g1580 [Ancylostoma ceylanicum]
MIKNTQGRRKREPLSLNQKTIPLWPRDERGASRRAGKKISIGHGHPPRENVLGPQCVKVKNLLETLGAVDVEPPRV